MRRRSPAFRLDSGRDGVQRNEGSAENDAAVDAAEPIVRVGSGRFVVTKRSFLITAAAVGLTAAGLVSLVAIVLPH